MFSEVCVLPKQNEKVSDQYFAMNVIYVGHKPTTRNEQIQRNWTIELQTYTESDEDSDDIQQEQLRRSPRKNKKQQTKSSASAASPAPRRSPRKKQNQKPLAPRRSPRKKKNQKQRKTNDSETPAESSSSDAESSSEQEPSESSEQESSSKKKLEFDDEDTPPHSGKKRKYKKKPVVGKKRKLAVLDSDVISMALGGDPAPLREYIHQFDMSRAKYEKKTPWEKVLPTWKSKKKARGLKTWQSKTARGEWDINGNVLCLD